MLTLAHAPGWHLSTRWVIALARGSVTVDRLRPCLPATGRRERQQRFAHPNFQPIDWKGDLWEGRKVSDGLSTCILLFALYSSCEEVAGEILARKAEAAPHSSRSTREWVDSTPGGVTLAAKSAQRRGIGGSLRPGPELARKPTSPHLSSVPPALAERRWLHPRAFELGVLGVLPGTAAAAGHSGFSSGWWCP